jgi:hypothetical protein
MAEFQISVREHRKTKLLVAFSDDLPGFIVHAHDEGELKQKLIPAFEAFMKATDRPVYDAELIEKTPLDFFPPAYVARGALDKAA